MKYVFAGDRDISVAVLDLLIGAGHRPSALLVSDKDRATHDEELIRISGLPPELIFRGKAFRDPSSLDCLRSLALDYIIGIHFPYIVPKVVLDIPRLGFLNLHPAYLPFNKGWHTPSWGILENTPIGATLHYMSEELDQGDLIHQKRCNIHPEDTAHSLYARLKALELETFAEALPWLVSLKPPRKPQEGQGTKHIQKDLKAVQEIKLADALTWEKALDQLRGLTTNQVEEASFFVKDGKRYFVQVTISPAHPLS